MDKKIKWILAAFIVFGFIGFLDAAYLTIEHYNQGILPCYIFEGCDKVTTSKYSEVFGLPVAMFGAIYYLLIVLTAIFYFDAKNKTALNILKIFPSAGFLASIWFVYVQLFVIEAICFYCMISAVTSTALFILSLFLIKFTKNAKQK
ncbi:MAG: hypothetical protein A3A94_01950 [Candidatus Portnoybacteria bacterium RIFCSPLOWO2_01_FULL_43_11]|uniref:Vitamin K epoxide reductase domain-containing protein n=3 Tax=Bacteria candidate phyla TaxID=1783234 RepID=A0A1G2FMU1_9BACT|nr:MAG: hypothetical protein A2713_01095 [candidate division WWE3 bacterium RIFCSPHIGHO2_01_FULL_35_17]OGZ36542.1 MAG: hypothetical protein A3D38_01075 [Candidatus Portnoybacteria bacterium RIFCSPHIGHO2_02_FULL_40_23]OGZ39066.1 MAG: hypothetical protein A3A94_01950 [Candidatus Portnoybacteria bacterium RIFCSPLOWO2_01_FULL_43_11]OGZ39343.1 MAG: hypothetical protein A3E90_01275 [Candidatus Portnoybacteria bacterium RIFCSPHIGHO2_12_FULL_40_11]